MAPVVNLERISRLWVQVQSKMAMKLEWKISCCSAPCKTDNLWDVKWGSQHGLQPFFFCYFFSLIQPVLQNHVCNRAEIKHTALYCSEKLFPVQWQQSWRQQSWCTAFIHSVELMEQTWTLHWQLNVHTHTHTHPHHAHSASDKRHTWTFKAGTVCACSYVALNTVKPERKSKW